MTKLQEAERKIRDVLGDVSTSDELKAAIETFLSMDIEKARDDTETLEELFANRFLASDEDKAMAAAFAGLNKHVASEDDLYRSVPNAVLSARCERSTDRLLHLIHSLERENVRPAVHRLTLFAIARAFVCKSVSDAGCDEGINDVRAVLENVIEDLMPMLRSARC